MQVVMRSEELGAPLSFPTTVPLPKGVVVFIGERDGKPVVVLHRQRAMSINEVYAVLDEASKALEDVAIKVGERLRQGSGEHKL